MTGRFATKIGENVLGIHTHDPMEEQNYPIRLSGIMMTFRFKISDPKAEKPGTSQMEGSRPGRQGNETRKQFAIYPYIFASRCVFCKVEVISFSKHPTF